MNKSFELLEALSNAFGTSGFEEDVRAVAQKHLASETFKDAMGNLFINVNEKKGTKPRVMLDAHMDEIGFMVHHVKPNGTLGYIELGRTMPTSMMAQKVVIRNQEGKYIKGVITSTPPHFGGGPKGDLTHESLSIDIGSTSLEETKEVFKIDKGCPVVPDVTTEYDAERDLLWAKGLDCRIGCGALIETMNNLYQETLNVELTAALSVQEEVGLRGAKVTANRVNPDVAIVFEGTPADDTFVQAYMVQTALKKGPMLRHIDASMITNPRFQKFALEVAKKHDIPVQHAVRTGGGTNGGAVHLANLGIPTIVIGIPVRYIHTPHTIATLADYKHGIKLAMAIVRELSQEVIDSF